MVFVGTSSTATERLANMKYVTSRADDKSLMFYCGSDANISRL